MHDRRFGASDRRRGRRRSFVASVKHCVGAETAVALAQDLGLEGMQLKRVRGRAYLPRTPILLTFELPDGGELVRVRGAVASERAEGAYQRTGVRFERVRPLDRVRIARWLAG
jgi:hypothetical protein